MSSLNKEILTKNILEQIRNKGITQTALAAKIGMSQPNFSKAMNVSEKKLFTLEQILALSEFFEISIEQLLGVVSPEKKKELSTRDTARILIQLVKGGHISFDKSDIREEAYVRDSFAGPDDYPFKSTDITITYNMIYFPEHWVVDYNFESDSEIMAGVGGNDTQMAKINGFLGNLKSVYEMYSKGQIDEDAFDVMAGALLEQLPKK